MKICQSTLVQSVCFWLVITILGPVGQGIAAQHCTDNDGFALACGNQQLTRLDLIEACTDIDGFEIPCRNQQKIRFDLAEACTDHEGLSIACDKPQENHQDQIKPLLTAQNDL